MSDTAAAQLRRILRLVPRLSDGEEHPIEEIAEILGVDRHTLLADLASLVDRFDAPGGFVEGVQFLLDETSISVVTQHFLRPMRLSMQELCALELGLAMLRSERTPEELPPIERALDRLRKVITKVPQNDAHEGVRHAELPAAGDRDQLKVVREAIKARTRVRLRYRAGGARRSSERTVSPYSLVFASGMWYVVALSDDGVRFFRADRIEGVTMTPQRFEVPAGFSIEDVIASGRAFHGEPVLTMRVRYSPRIARWIAEREREDSRLAPDGSLTLEHPVADIDWAVRHVLQYGPEAEVLEPPEVREEIVRRLTPAIRR
jgi:predicted DNA-binding transcriptional regulator YafY